MLFGTRLPLAERYVALLADTGVSHGLLGPREVPRLWERHVLNCAVIEDSFPAGATVIDVGSGAGLPGVALAVARPDLTVHLVEPMLRRVTWLTEVVDALGLGQVRVHRGRAEEVAGALRAPWVTARAVARLGTLAGWCRPLLAAGGTVIAVKGSSAQQELAEDRAHLDALGLVQAQVTAHGAGLVEPPTLTVDLRFGADVPASGRGRSRGRPETRPSRGLPGRSGGRRHR